MSERKAVHDSPSAETKERHRALQRAGVCSMTRRCPRVRSECSSDDVGVLISGSVAIAAGALSAVVLFKKRRVIGRTLRMPLDASANVFPACLSNIHDKMSSFFQITRAVDD